MALHTGRFQSGKTGQAGQAMTEMIIASSFVLIPLFLLIPWLGKYIDLTHSTVQAARYEAWEYTVWYSDVSTEAPTNAVDKNGSQIAMPEKSITKTHEETQRRFFSLEAYSSVPDEADLVNETPWDPIDTNPLWKDHLGTSLLQNPAGGPVTPNSTFVASSDDTPSNLTSDNPNFKEPLRVDKLIFDAATSAGGKIANLIAGTSPTFVIGRLKGYSHTTLTVPITSQPGLVTFGTISGNYAIGATHQTLFIPVITRAAVLSDGWNAGGRYHAKKQVGEMAIARKLTSLSDKFTALSDYQWIKGSDHIHPTLVTPTGEFADLLKCGELRGDGWGVSSPPVVTIPADDEDGSLWTGYVDMGAIHPDRLHVVAATDYTVEPNTIGGHNCTDNICNFTYNNSYQYPWADPLVDDKLSAPDDCD